MKSEGIIFYIVMAPFAILAAGILIALWCVAIITIVEVGMALIYHAECLLRKPVARIIRVFGKKRGNHE